MHTRLFSLLVLVAGAVAMPFGLGEIWNTRRSLVKRSGVQYVGVNIAGFDFGCISNGTCIPSHADPPLVSLGGADGIGQMSHFVKDDNMNIFRLPVGWQYLVNNSLGGTLNAKNLANYDQLMQGCLATGASCILDIHNYARWNGGVIGQGGPSNEQFTSLWTQLATKYNSSRKVIFGIMNEPHDMPDFDKWTETVQEVVNAIRGAGATTQMILLPGTNYTSAQTFSTTSGPDLVKVTNPNGTTTGLIFDVHKYLDSDGSGTHTECTTNNIAYSFSPLATWLRANKRQALNTETGGGNTQSCETDLCQQIAFVNNNSDVFLGYVGWSAGAFNASTYELSEVPIKNGNTWTDSALAKACFKRVA